MKIMLTGACGLAGRAILQAARAIHEVVPLDVAPAVESLPGGICASILDRDRVLRAAEGCQAIIHTAAMHSGWIGKASHSDFLKTNVLGSENLFSAAVAQGVRRLIISSTLQVLCGRKWDASGRAVLDETLPPRPDWIYPLSKLMTEELGHYFARHAGLEVIQLRYAWVMEGSIEQMGLNLLARGVAAGDVASANLLAAAQPGLRDEVLLIGPSVPFTQTDIDLAQVDPWQVLENHWPGSGDVLRQRGLELNHEHFWPVCRIDKARRVLGWSPGFTFDRFLAHIGWRSPTRTPGKMALDATGFGPTKSPS